ncbi:hypothetical protein TSOC_013226, partial [Tetrabaena socialis]
MARPMVTVQLHGQQRVGPAGAVENGDTPTAQPNALKVDWTALHWASYSGRKEVVEALLRAGADKEAKDTHLGFAVTRQVVAGGVGAEAAAAAGAARTACRTSAGQAAAKRQQLVMRGAQDSWLDASLPGFRGCSSAEQAAPSSGTAPTSRSSSCRQQDAAASAAGWVAASPSTAATSTGSQRGGDRYGV